MSNFVTKHAGTVLTGLLCTASVLWPAAAAQNTRIPNFMDDATVGWLAAHAR